MSSGYSEPSADPGEAGSSRGDVGEDGLLASTLDSDHYDPARAMRLMAIGRDRDEPWDRRRVAALLLEIEFLRIDADDQPAQSRFFEALRIRDVQPDEVCLRLSRFAYIHRGSVADLLAHAECECNLFFGRYLFRAYEVVERILAHVRITEGKNAMRRLRLPMQHPWNTAEAKLAIKSLPPYERAIVRGLMQDSRIYWVDDATPSRIGSLVEFPLGTVALAIKPPGSSYEIEIKRCGVRGPRAMEVRRQDDSGKRLPKQHQLYGASMGDCLLWESGGGSAIARFFRRVHGSESPSSRLLSLARIRKVPGALGPVALRDYLDDPSHYGDGFDAMRCDLPFVVDDYTRRKRSEEELVDAFLTATEPAQSIVIGTSSFRLDGIAQYLAPNGASSYFGALGVSCSADDTRRFADTILGEVIDDYAPPSISYESYAQYVSAALAANRAAADATYTSVFSQIGMLWGTLMAARVYTCGESFAARNAGLRRVWEDGRWRVKWFSMDHDSLQMIGRRYRHFHPIPDINGMIQDQAHILGGPLGRFQIRGELQSMKAIYRPDTRAASNGYAAFRAALRESYAKAHHAIRHEPSVKLLFRRQFTETVQEWDEAMGDFLTVRYDAEGIRKWMSRTRSRLIRHGIPPRIAAQYLAVALDMVDLLPWFGYLYPKPKRRKP